MNSAEDAIARLCNPQAEVSAHYVISRHGGITRLVAEDQRAWHAGGGEWAGQDDINSRSIGIELDNRGTHPFAEPQMMALESLLKSIMMRLDIQPKGVIGHSDMAPGRKSDPGPHFDWARLARQGLAYGGSESVSVTNPSKTAFIKAAQAAGFTADVPFDDLLSATRLRFAPWRRGPLTSDDLVLAHHFAH